VATGSSPAIPVLFVECRTDQQEVLRRLRERAGRGTGPSDATEEIYLRQRTEFVPISEVSVRQHLVVDTTEGTERALPYIEKALGHLFEAGQIVGANDSSKTHAA
jgi:predicted kinase